MDGVAQFLAHRSLKEEVFQALHGRIIEGTYQPGAWLRQEEIAVQMGVSMTPVREALDLLVAAGLAERVPYRGVRVKQLSHCEIAEAYGMRLLLEALAARLAASRISTTEVEQLRRLLGEMEARLTLAEMPRARELNREFHLSVVRASGDSMLLKLYSIVSNSFPDWMLYEAMYRHPEKLASSLQAEAAEHRALLDSLTRRDTGGAARHAVEHILHMGQDLEVLLGIPRRELDQQVEAIIPFLQH